MALAVLIQLVVAIIIVGLIIWLVQTYLPIPVIFKNLIVVLVVIFLIIYLLRAFGLLH